jgi:outer membrane murein-binding lipoprotein Lpp
MNTRNFAAFILSGLLLAGCAQEQAPAADTKAPALNAEMPSGHQDEHQHPSSSAVALMDGKKWKANAATTERIRKMAAMASQAPRAGRQGNTTT